MDWYAWLCRAGLHPDVALDYALLFARNELVADDVRHLDHQFLATMGVAVAKHRLEILKLARRESSSSSSHAVSRAAAAITALPRRATRLLAAAVHRSARSALGRLRASVSSSSPASSSSRGGGPDRNASNPAAALRALATPPRLPLPPRRRGGRVAHSWGKLVASPSPSPVATRGGKPLAPLPLMLAHHVSKPVLLTSSCAVTVRALPAPPPAAAAVVAGGFTNTEPRGRNDKYENEDDASCDADMEQDEEMDGVEEEEMRWESMFQDLKPT